MTGDEKLTEIARLQSCVDELRERFASYAGGDRAPPPHVSLMRDLREAESALSVAMAAMAAAAQARYAAPPEGLVRAEDVPGLETWRELCEEAYPLLREQQEAVLRYARALAAGGVDREWLGRDAHAAVHGPGWSLLWWHLSEEDREIMRRIGARLFALGQAHGDPLRGEGAALLEASSAAIDATSWTIDRATR